MGKLVEKIKNGKALKWAKENLPNALEFVGDITGVSQLNLVADLIGKDENLSEGQKIQFKEIYELELKELDLYLKDVDSARNREIEMAKTDKSDWMMYLVGIIGLVSFMIVIYAIIWIPEMQENKMFIHLVGMVEGVIITKIFGYYYGTSKSSSDKTNMLRMS